MKSHNYRHSFIFLEKDLSPQLKTELKVYIRNYHEELEGNDKDEALSYNDLFTYSTSDTPDYSENKLPEKIFVVVFYGKDWMNFINAVLDFNQAFPKSKIRTADIYKYTLLDENGSLEDMPDIRSN